MPTLEDLVKVENKYKNMKDGASVLFQKAKQNDAVNIMTNNFRVILGKKNMSFTDASVLADIFSSSLIMFEEAMEKEAKERFFEFVSSTFSKEFLKGKKEVLLFNKMLKRMGRKLGKEKRENEKNN